MVSCFLFSSLILLKFDFPKFHYFITNPSYDPNLLITINCNNPNCSRAKEAYSIWGENILKTYNNVEIMFVTTFDNVTDPQQTILCRQRQLKIQYRQMFYNNYRAYSHFYFKTNKEYLFRTTEDVFIHQDNFMHLMERIEKENADSDKPLFIAEVIFPSKWVHGGPGWIMNRAATKIWLDNTKHMNQYFEFHNVVGDDVIIDEYQRISHIPWENMHTNLFYGFPITNKTEKILKQREWRSFGKCPPINTSFPSMRSKVSDVAVWHSGTSSNFAVLHGREIIEKAPSDLFMYYDQSKYGEFTSFCYE